MVQVRRCRCVQVNNLFQLVPESPTQFHSTTFRRCTKEEAINRNYGGDDDRTKYCSSAYMLVYIRTSAMPDILQPIDAADIPSELIDRLVAERRMEHVRKCERADANDYMTVNVLLEEYIEGHNTTDLYDTERVHFRIFRLRKADTVGDLVDLLADVLRTQKQRLRIWPLLPRSNRITRLTPFEWRANRSEEMSCAADWRNPWVVFVEQCGENAPPLAELPEFDREGQALVFLKYYDQATRRLNYCGLRYVGFEQRLSELVPDMCRRAALPVGTVLTVYEQQELYGVQRLDDLNETLETALNIRNLSSFRDCDGTVLIFEKSQQQQSKLKRQPMERLPSLSATSPPSSPPFANEDDEIAATTSALDVAASSFVTPPLTPSANTPSPPSTGGGGGNEVKASAAWLASNVAATPPADAGGGGDFVRNPFAVVERFEEMLTCDEYFRDLLHRVDVMFVDRTVESDGGFKLQLTERMTYQQMATAVGQKIEWQPNKIQFFKCQQ